MVRRVPSAGAGHGFREARARIPHSGQAGADPIARKSGKLPALILYGKLGRKVNAFHGETDMKALKAATGKLS